MLSWGWRGRVEFIRIRLGQHSSYYLLNWQSGFIDGYEDVRHKHCYASDLIMPRLCYVDTYVAIATDTDTSTDLGRDDLGLILQFNVLYSITLLQYTSLLRVLMGILIVLSKTECLKVICWRSAVQTYTEQPSVNVCERIFCFGERRGIFVSLDKLSASRL